MKISNLFFAVLLGFFAFASNHVVENGPTSIGINQGPLALLKKKGCKVFISGNDSNAQTHLKKELEFYDVWDIKLNKSEATFEVKLLTKKTGIANADREVRLVITQISSGKEVYASPVVRGTDYGLKSMNLKQAAIKNLVENEIKTTFFQ